MPSFVRAAPLQTSGGKPLVSRPRISLDTLLGGMMVLEGGSHEQTQEGQEGYD